MHGCPPPWTRKHDGPLAELLEHVHYQPGYTFSLWHHNGETVLAIDHDTHNAYHPDQPYTVTHRFKVADRGTGDWQRWLLDRILDTHTHEACEWLTIDGQRPYDPHHTASQHAYQIHDWTQT